MPRAELASLSEDSEPLSGQDPLAAPWRKPGGRVQSRGFARSRGGAGRTQSLHPGLGKSSPW